MLTLSYLSSNFFFICLLYCYDNNSISNFLDFDNQMQYSTNDLGAPVIRYWSNLASEPTNEYLMEHYSAGDEDLVKKTYQLQQKNAPILMTVDDDLLTVINVDTAISNGAIIWKVPENEIWMKTGTSTWIAVGSAPALSIKSLTPKIRKMSADSFDTLDDEVYEQQDQKESKK